MPVEYDDDIDDDDGDDGDGVNTYGITLIRQIGSFRGVGVTPVAWIVIHRDTPE